MAAKRGGDGVEEAIAPIPFFDQGFAVVVGLGWGVAQIVRGMAIHQDVVGDHPEAAGLGGSEKRLDGFRVDGGENEGGGGAVA